MGADHHRLRRGTAVLTASGIAYPRKAKTIITEYARGGVRVNAVAPGPVETEMFNRFTGRDAAAKAGFVAHVPANRTATPEEIAQTILFVASDKAPYMTGASIAIDGGKLAS
jgi:NAD(P)-dependent dehydrogenase (short-subunit alcohol dehydrogenase family)